MGKRDVVLGGGSKVFGWWKKICGVKDVVGVQNVGWFETGMRRQLGSGENSSF